MSLLSRFTGGMSRADRKTWATANNLTDLGELTAQWLEGRIDSQPGYYGPVDVDEDEAPGLTAALIMLNRIRFVTDSSQAGYNPGGDDCGGDHPCDDWQQRAAISGYAEDTTLAWLIDAVEGTRFQLLANERRPNYKPCPGTKGVVVTTRGNSKTGDRESYTVFGRPLSARDIDALYDMCSDDARSALKGAWQVVVYDPEWGPNDLWMHLTRFAGGA